MCMDVLYVVHSANFVRVNVVNSLIYIYINEDMILKIASDILVLYHVFTKDCNIMFSLKNHIMFHGEHFEQSY